MGGRKKYVIFRRLFALTRLSKHRRNKTTRKILQTACTPVSNEEVGMVWDLVGDGPGVSLGPVGHDLDPAVQPVTLASLQNNEDSRVATVIYHQFARVQ